MEAAMWILMAILACSAEPAPLDANFGSRLTERYACGLGWYVAYDEEHTIRLQAGFRDLGGYDYEPEPGEAQGLIDGEVVTLQVYTGRCLWTPGCTDDLGAGDTCNEQEILQKYEATSGTLALWADEVGVGGEVMDLELEDRGQPDVAVEYLELPEADYWSE